MFLEDGQIFTSDKDATEYSIRVGSCDVCKADGVPCLGFDYTSGAPVMIT